MRSSPRIARLAAIRMAILLGVLMFGAVAWYQRRSPDWQQPEGIAMRPMRLAGMAVWAIAVIGIITLRIRFAREVESASNARVAIVAWALAELPALFGAVFYYLTGDITLFAAGTGALVVAFLLFPVGRRV
jgi:hypothetical protein